MSAQIVRVPTSWAALAYAAIEEPSRSSIG